MTTKYTSSDLLKKIITYCIEGFAVSLVLTLIFKKIRSYENILLIGLTATALFSIMDLYSPTISNFVRQGTGFGLGINLTGLNGLGIPIPPIS